MVAEFVKVYNKLIKQLQRLLRAGDAAGCERLILARLAKMPESPFHIAVGMTFGDFHPPIKVAKEFDAFFIRQSKRFPVGAIYTEGQDVAQFAKAAYKALTS